MTDDTPLDLYRLDPGAPPDLVKGAMKKFRWRAVIFALAAIVACASVAGGIAYFGTHYDFTAKSTNLARQLPTTERAIIYGGGRNCTTPTYRVGSVNVTLLQIAPLGDGWALHVIVDAGDTPVTVQRTSSDISAPRSMFISPVDAGTGPATGQTFLAYTQAGWTTAELYVAVPAGLGDRFDMRLTGTRGEELGIFTIDLDELGITVGGGTNRIVDSAC